MRFQCSVANDVSLISDTKLKCATKNATMDGSVLNVEKKKTISN